tara:strand:- start:1327 stop:2316 length:990 start_codon:yes stop_codon:yes gene_type:complete
MAEKTIPSGFYGDEARWFIGVVESTNDPLFLGRLRVRIFGIHSADENNIPEEALPWAQIVAPITHGGTSGINGSPVGIKKYAQVYGIFLDGRHSQLPLVFGSIPKIEGKAINPNNTTGGVPPTGPPINTVGDVAVNMAGRPPVSMTFAGGSNVEKVYNLLEEAFRVDLRLSNSKELAAGFVGNFQAESGPSLDYLAHNSAAGGNGANGIAQWRGMRFANLVNYALSIGEPLEKNSGGKDVPSLKVQAAFVIHEISGGDSYETSNFNKYIKTTQNARYAASAVEAYYERAETALKNKSFDVRYKKGHSIKKRIDYAAEVYAAFTQRKTIQ